MNPILTWSSLPPPGQGREGMIATSQERLPWREQDFRLQEDADHVSGSCVSPILAGRQRANMARRVQKLAVLPS
jgi:hypothetical protein